MDESWGSGHVGWFASCSSQQSIEGWASTLNLDSPV